MSAIEKLIRYVKIDTMSNEKSTTVPSSRGQMELARLLQEELEALGLSTTLDDKGYLFGVLPGNTTKRVKKLGLLAHLDTSPDLSGAGVKPRLLAYQGGDIVLNEDAGIVMRVADFPSLARYVGQDLLVTDGNTLLGADDKAGIAEIMEVLEYLKGHPEVKHGDIHVAFTPDEEIGRGPHHFDVQAFGADVAYTLDGGPLGELEFENFNAASAKVVVRGRNVHPGTAKDKMVNSIFLAMEYARQFDTKDTPEHTEGYEGFFHLNDVEGSVEETTLHYIIRDFFEESFLARKARMVAVAEAMNAQHGQGTITVHLAEQYRNMKERILPHMYLVDHAKRAMELAGVVPDIKPIRGGTDGAQLSYMGLPCPNLFTGGENYHGRFEFVSKQSMDKAVEVVVHLIRLFEEAGE